MMASNKWRSGSRCSSTCMSNGSPLRSANSNSRSRNAIGSSAYCGNAADGIGPGGDCAASHCLDASSRLGASEVRCATTCSVMRSRQCSRSCSIASTPRSSVWDSMLVWLRIATVPCARQISSVLLGARDDVFAGHRGGELAIAGRGSFQRCAGIGDRAPCPRLVEMLMGVDQPGHDELAVQVDDSSCGRIGDRRSHCGNSTVLPDRQIQWLGPLGAGLQNTTTPQQQGNTAHDRFLGWAGRRPNGYRSTRLRRMLDAYRTH